MTSEMRSSYAQNNYSYLFDALVRINKPKTIVECGILDGYSLFAMASAAKTYTPNGFVTAFDLFDDYDFKHGNEFQIETDLENYGLDNVKLVKMDANEASNLFVPNSVDFLHIDIANTHQRLKLCISSWLPCLKEGSILVFEGGSTERDNVEWMKKYDHLSIGLLFGEDWFLDDFEHIVIEPFPSLTICKRK